MLLLLGAGLAAGYVAGLIGVGGGIIFAPVLFFYYQQAGIGPETIAPLTIGTSLLCTLIAASSSAWHQHRKKAVMPRVAWQTGFFGAMAVFATTRWVTTRPWYDGTTFQVVFSLVLLVVVARMLVARGTTSEPVEARRHGLPALFGTGVVAGTVATAAGVGGGVVLVPAYHNLLGLSMHRSVGTSSATIVLISAFGVLNYALSGRAAIRPDMALGYVDGLRALVLAVPAVFSARLGVWTAHRIDTRRLRWCFALLALIVAVRLLVDAFG